MHDRPETTEQPDENTPQRHPHEHDNFKVRFKLGTVSAAAADMLWGS